MLGDANIILLFAFVLVAGTVSGAIAKRFHLPSVTGQILVGILVGPALGWFTRGQAHRLDPVVDFALGLMAVAVGSHLHFRRLHVARRRLLAQITLESTLTPLLVCGCALLVPGVPVEMAVLLAAISVATAPATILAIVKETRSKGVFVKTLIASVAMNNLACICLFEVAHAATAATLDPETSGSFMAVLWAPAEQIGLALLLGGGLGILLVVVTRRVVRPDRLTALSLIAILLTVGLAQEYDVSVLLSCLLLGMVLANLTPDKEEIGHQVFDNFEYAIFAVFFTIAGIELSFEYLLPAGLLATVVFAARIVGKTLASSWAMRYAGATKPMRRYLGLALIPQAGLAVGLMLLVTEDSRFHEISEFFLAVVLSIVLLNELIGPLMTRWALRLSGDFGKDRARVIAFLHEENITTQLRGDSKEEAFEQLVDLCISSNRLTLDREELLTAVRARESEASTSLGSGLALPHTYIEGSNEIVGAMGISSKGLRLDTPDGQPVHCIVLLLTPKSQRGRHLAVVSALARAIGGDRSIQQQLYHIDTPAHAYELLHADEESEEFNYYLDDEDED